MQSVPVEIFATKGTEYLVVVAYLVALVGFWRLLTRASPRAATAAAERSAQEVIRGWFEVPESLYFHPAHTWAQTNGDDVVTIGADAFATKLIGRPDVIDLPRPGTRLRQGEPAWRFEADARAIPMLSPVDGEVVEVNEEIVRRPELVSLDPYEQGWLLRVRLAKSRRALGSLLDGELARMWMDRTVENLRQMQAGALGVVMPDGGVPVDGFARALAPDRWDEIARQMLLSD
jgi:glycine cleavage system H protein